MCVYLYIHTGRGKKLKFNGKIFWKDLGVFVKLVSLLNKKGNFQATVRISYTLVPVPKVHSIEPQKRMLFASYTQSHAHTYTYTK